MIHAGIDTIYAIHDTGMMILLNPETQSEDAHLEKPISSRV